MTHLANIGVADRNLEDCDREASFVIASSGQRFRR